MEKGFIYSACYGIVTTVPSEEIAILVVQLLCDSELAVLADEEDIQTAERDDTMSEFPNISSLVLGKLTPLTVCVDDGNCLSTSIVSDERTALWLQLFFSWFFLGELKYKITFLPWEPTPSPFRVTRMNWKN